MPIQELIESHVSAESEENEMDLDVDGPKEQLDEQLESADFDRAQDPEVDEKPITIIPPMFDDKEEPVGSETPLSTDGLPLALHPRGNNRSFSHNPSSLNNQ